MYDPMLPEDDFSHPEDELFAPLGAGVFGEPTIATEPASQAHYTPLPLQVELRSVLDKLRDLLQESSQAGEFDLESEWLGCLAEQFIEGTYGLIYLVEGEHGPLPLAEALRRVPALMSLAKQLQEAEEACQPECWWEEELGPTS